VLRKTDLKRKARRLAKEGQRGWLTPTGAFFEADETPGVRISGLELGGHERAALAYIEERRPDLCDQLNAERSEQGFETWVDTDGHDVIKKFMFKHGFVRVAQE
jgi:hypothetical protein